jgi:hypothetical protein
MNLSSMRGKYKGRRKEKKKEERIIKSPILPGMPVSTIRSLHTIRPARLPAFENYNLHCATLFIQG